MKILFAALLVFFLSACASTQASYDPATGVITSIDSRDLADHLNYKAYATNGKDDKAKPIFNMTAHEGQTIQLSGVKSISVWAPETGRGNSGLQAPVQRKSAFVEGLAAVGQFSKDVGSWFVPAWMFTEQNKTSRHQSDNNLEQYKINTEAWSGVSQSWSNTTNTAITKKPDVFMVPMGSTEAAAPPAPEVPAE
jgi:hypothetical protein